MIHLITDGWIRKYCPVYISTDLKKYLAHIIYKLYFDRVIYLSNPWHEYLMKWNQKLNIMVRGTGYIMIPVDMMKYLNNHEKSKDDSCTMIISTNDINLTKYKVQQIVVGAIWFAKDHDTLYETSNKIFKCFNNMAYNIGYEKMPDLLDRKLPHSQLHHITIEYSKKKFKWFGCGLGYSGNTTGNIYRIESSLFKINKDLSGISIKRNNNISAEERLFGLTDTDVVIYPWVFIKTYHKTAKINVGVQFKIQPRSDVVNKTIKSVFESKQSV